MRGKVAEVKQEDGSYCPSPVSITKGLPGSSSSEATPENSDSEAEARGRSFRMQRLRLMLRSHRELDDAPAKKPKKNPNPRELDDDAPAKKPKKNLNPGRRIIGGRVYDSMLGETCHWCRQKTVEDHVHCAKCTIKFCGLCLANRNGENIKDEMEEDGEWICPKCRGGCGAGCENCCNCGPCRKLQGLEPTGALVQRARAAGFTNVHDYLIHLKTGESAEEIADRKLGRNWIKGEGATAVKFVRNSLSTPIKQPLLCSQDAGAGDLSATPTPVKRMRGALTADSLSLHLSQSQSEFQPSQADFVGMDSTATRRRILNQEETSAPEVKQEVDVLGIEDGKIVVKVEKTDSSREGSPVRDEIIKQQIQTEKMAVVEDVGVVVKVEKMDDPGEGSPLRDEVIKEQIVKEEKTGSPREGSPVRDEIIKQQVQTEKMAVVEDVGVVTVEKMDDPGEGSPLRDEVLKEQIVEEEKTGSPREGSPVRDEILKQQIQTEKMAVVEDAGVIVQVESSPVRDEVIKPREGSPVRDEIIKQQVQTEKMAVVEDAGVVVQVESSPVRDEVIKKQIQAEDVEAVGRNENNSDMDEDKDEDCGEAIGVDYESEETAEPEYSETSGSKVEVPLDDEEDEEDEEEDAYEGNVDEDINKEECEAELGKPHEDAMQTTKGDGACNHAHLLGAIEEEEDEDEEDIEQGRKALEHAAKFRASLKRGRMVHSSFGHLIECAPGVKQEYVDSFESESEEEDGSPATQDSSLTESSGLDANTGTDLVDEGFVPVRDVGRLYSEQLQKELEKPFGPRQLAEMLEEASKRKAILRHRETRQRTVCVETQNEGLSYLDHHPDLAAKLVSAKDPQGKLQLLRGFFFWLQRACNPGAYKPWVSPLQRSNQNGDDCCEVDGPDCEITAVVVSVDEKRAARNLFRKNGRDGQSDPGGRMASPTKSFSGELVKVKSEVIKDEE